MLKSLVIFVIASNVNIATSAEISKISDPTEDQNGFARDCVGKYSAACLKLDIVSWVDSLNEDDSYSVLPGVTVVRENGTADIVADLARSPPNDPDARLDALLLRKVANYLSSHSVSLNLFGTSAEGARKGGGGGKKGGAGMGAILAAGAMMKGTLMAMTMSGLAAMAGKALMTGLVSLMLSVIVGIKSLTSGGGKSTTYEVIAKPIYTHSNTHSASHEDHGGHYGHSSYRRSLDVPLLPAGHQTGFQPSQ